MELLEECGSCPEADIRELWKRALFSCAVGNTDNHMRNYGFLHNGRGWRLSPVFDVNPTAGDQPKMLNTALGFDDARADPMRALDVCEYFRLTRNEARKQAISMSNALGKWRKLAVADGISQAFIGAMESCFESGMRRLREL